MLGGTIALGLIVWVFISVFRWGIFRFAIVIYVLLSILSLVGEAIEPTMNIYFHVATALSLAFSTAALYFVFRPDAGHGCDERFE